ncbi:protein COFACTOR ASSEMBLY OF COMPLEX C SUBUNIT B CCB2, chloroplastic [Cornus florida]|uniref:protein COFACTOR ASSEMBLY OF COMPLEX C SUBUNIT B CCB2, chloroplastic n=1 Tax=Cornus florida TaxID=4283 RepID=UPI00289ADBA2|nr:protein COFACTOR ASSEMBLY OF COMPLEX C SUBUNIT B CCB2, chloroplastic [Cornus florida]
MSSGLTLNPLFSFKFPLKNLSNYCFFQPGISKLYTRKRKLSNISCTRLDDSQRTTNQQQLNLSVLRFTLGIPGLDESYLPRWIGYAFGSLLLLNHFVGSNSTTTTPAQLRSEALGLSLAAFSIVLPYLGQFLKGATTQVDQATLPEGAGQIFAMSQNISDTLKEDLAWGTYILLRNTNTISVLISVRGALCVRGYWNTPVDLSKDHVLDWFEKQIERIGLSDLEDTLYFPQRADSEIWDMLPKGVGSLLVQPVLQSPNRRNNQMEKAEGFVLLASTINYAYSIRDRGWIGAVANKFRDEGTV